VFQLSTTNRSGGRATARRLTRCYASRNAGFSKHNPALNRTGYRPPVSSVLGQNKIKERRRDLYCQKCGKKMEISAKFCPNCGSQVSGGFLMKESDTPLLILKPVFVPLLIEFSVLPLIIFFTIWGGGFFGGFGLFAIKVLGLNLPGWFTFVFFSCLFFFGIPIVTHISKKKNYEKTEYRFYNTKLEYYEGFFNIDEKTVNYKNITEVSLRKGVFQKQYGLGTIVLSTPATDYPSDESARSGIMVADIKNPDETYSRVKELISKFS